MAINRDKILQEAQKLVDKKRYDKAIAEYQKVVADEPTDVRTLLKIGNLYLQLEQYADAISTYERVGSHYSQQGFSVKAVAVYKQIREIIQKHAPHLEDRFGHIVPKLAELLTQLDLRSDALAYYDEMANRLQRLGRDRDAIDVFRKILALDQNNPVSHLRLGDAFARVRDFDGAVGEYQLAAEILVQLGRKEDALRVVDRLLQHRPEGRFARMSAELHLDRGQPADTMAALTKLQIAVKENPKDLDTLGLLARAFDQLGQPAKAVEVHKEAARIAREAQNKSVYERLIDVLVTRAPNDEGVRQLAQSGFEQSAGPKTGQRSAISTPTPMPPEPVRLSSAPPPPPAPSPIPERRPAPTAPKPAAPPMPAARMQQAPAARHPGYEPETTPIPMGDEPIESMSNYIEPPIDLDPLSEDVLVIDDDLEVLSEDEPPIPLRNSAPPIEGDPARAALARAESHRRASDYDAAVLVLRNAIVVSPGARDLRERLCDVLIESGDQDEAISEMIAFAHYLVSVDDADASARLLDEVLLLEPQQSEALALLHSLGYAVPSTEVVELGSQDVAFDSSVQEYEQAAAPTGRQAVPDDLDMGPPSSGVPHPSDYDPLGPLPSYDLDDLTADEIPVNLADYPPASGRQAQVARPGEIVLDDPFDLDGSAPAYVARPASPGRGIPPVGNAPSVEPRQQRPSMLLKPPPGSDIQAPERRSYPDIQPPIEQPSYSEPAPRASYAEVAPEPPVYGEPEQRRSYSSSSLEAQARGFSLDESALEEIEFFQANGLFDEAESLLNEQLSRLPSHPLLLDCQRELANLRAAASQRPTDAPPALHGELTEPPRQDTLLGSTEMMSLALAGGLVGGGLDAASHDAPPASATHYGAPGGGFADELTAAGDVGDHVYDIAHALDALDALDDFAEESSAHQTHQVSVEAIFEQFKAGVAAQIAESDSSTHYDLGVAYKEMGLVTDALAEFELASRDPARECVCRSMIGMIHMEQGNMEQAIDAFLLGLEATQRTQEQEAALTYEIGNAYQMRNAYEQALYYFRLVARIDPSFRDFRGSVAERMGNLERLMGGGGASPAQKAAAVGAGDEFDAAFDDLFKP